MVQFHAKLVTTHIQLTIPRHKKLKPRNLKTDAGGEREENGKSLSVEKFVVVGSMFTPSLIDVV